MSSEDHSEPVTTEAVAAGSVWRGRIRIAAIGLFASLLVLRIALPSVLEWAIPRLAADQNVFAEVGNIDLGLIAGEITIEDLVVDLLPRLDTDETPPLLSLDRAYVAFEWTDLLFEQLHLTDLELVHPSIHVVQLDDGSFELPAPPVDDAPEPAESAPAPEPEVEASAEAGWAILLDRFDLQNPEVTLHSEIAGEEVVRLGAERLGFDALFVGAEGIGLGDFGVERSELFVEREWLLAQLAGSENVAPEVETPADPLEATATEISSIQMRHLNIDGAQFTVRTNEGPVEVAIRLALTEPGTDPGQTFPIDLALKVDDAMVGIDGRLGLNPVFFEGQLEWEGLSVPPFLLLAYPKLVPWLESCDASGDLEVVFRSVAGDGPVGLTASGSSSVDSMSFRQPDRGELAVGWDSFDFDIREAFLPLDATAGLPTRVELARVALVSPRLVYTNPADALDELLAAFENDSTEEEEPPTEVFDVESGDDGPAPMIAIDEFLLSGGDIRYVDRSVKPRHETRIYKLRTKVEALATTPMPGARRIEIDGLIQSTGSFKLRGGLPGGDGELDFSLRELDLISYDSLARGAGLEIESGRTSLDSSIVATDGAFSTRNELVLHDLDVALKQGDGFADRFGMSIDVVLALLRDSSGNISLSVPVGIDREGGAGIEFGPIVVSALRGAIQGAIASRVQMLGMLVPEGESADSLGAIEFRAGDQKAGPDARPQLDGLVELVAARPMLALSLRGHWSEADREPTARRILAEKAESGAAFPDVEGDGFFASRRVAAALLAEAESSEGSLSAEDAALLERYLSAEAVSDDRLRQLASARAKVLHDALVELGAPEDALSLGSSEAAERPGVSVELDTRSSSVASLNDG